MTYMLPIFIIRRPHNPNHSSPFLLAQSQMSYSLCHRAIASYTYDYFDSRFRHIDVLFDIYIFFLLQCPPPLGLLGKLLLQTGAYLLTLFFLILVLRALGRNTYAKWHLNSILYAIQRIDALLTKFCHIRAT